MNDRMLVRLLAAGRVVIGLGLVAAPARAGSLWIGKRSKDPATQVLVRATGGRDVALGLGTLWALGGSASMRPWLYGAAIADLTDAAATVAAGDSVPESLRNSALAVASSAALSGIVLGSRLG